MSSRAQAITSTAALRDRLWWLAIFVAPFLFLALMHRWIDSLADANSAWQVRHVAALVSQTDSIEQLPSSGWEIAALPHLVMGDGEQPTNAWYRVDVQIDRPQEDLWAVYFEQPSTNYAIYVNGQFVGEGAPMRHPLARFQTPLIFKFPGSLLHPGTNIVHVRSATEIAWSILQPFQIGPERALAPTVAAATFAFETLKQILVGCMLAIGLVMATLSISRAREAIFGWYAVALLFMAIHIAIKIAPQLPLGDARLWYNMDKIALGGYIVCATFFINRFVGVQRPRAERNLLLWAIGGAIILLLDPLVFGFQVPWLAYWVWLPPMLPVCVYQAWLHVRVARNAPNVETLSLAAMTWLGLVVGIRDGVIEMGLGTGPLFLAYVMGPVLSTFAFILLRRFVRAVNTAELARAELEVRVREKTAELHQTLVRMKDLEREQALSAERERIMRDMHDGVGGQLVQALSIATSRPELKPVEEPLRSCLEELRLIIDSIEPVNGDLASVLGTLRMRMSRRLSEAGIQLRWHIDDLPILADFGPSRVLHVLRIVHEAIANSLKHSHAQHITLTTFSEVRMGHRHIVIEVADDGTGIASTMSHGRGHINMRRRAEELSAELTVHSSGQGTTVRLALPITVLSNRDSAATQPLNAGASGPTGRIDSKP